tara:strand:- start:5137 stop:5268 length:132 start_codon:yes stop_codon:yes gene_type:complete
VKEKFLQLWFRVMMKIKSMKKEEVVIKSQTITPEDKPEPKKNG